MSIWKPGEPISARKLNAHSAVKAQVEVSGPPGSLSKFGSHVGMTNPDMTNTGMWIRVTSDPVASSVTIASNTTQSVKLHSWEAIYWNDGRKKWEANPGDYGNVTNNPCSTEPWDYDAVIASSLGNLTKTADANLTANGVVQNGVTPYFAVRDPVSRRLIAIDPGGSGRVQANSTETVLMILGDYDTYKDCPNVPAKPPTVYTDYCNGTRGTDLCVPAYAYAVYQRCGYVWNKIGDTRTYQVWANELNGGSAGNRRLHIPRWGGNLTASGPDPNDDCMGVAFLNSGASSLTCSCPTCLSSPPPDKQLCVKFKTPPRPCPLDPANRSCGYGCGDAFIAMDDAGAWDKEFIIPLTAPYCNPLDSTPDGLFTFEWQYSDGYSLGCDWGPDVYDPCDPCEHWGVLGASLTINAGNFANCGGSGIWRGDYKARDLCNLLCDCDRPPVRPVFEKPCNACSGFHFVISESIELICCPTEVSDSANDLTLTVQDTGNTTFGFEDQTL